MGSVLFYNLSVLHKRRSLTQSVLILSIFKERENMREDEKNQYYKCLKVMCDENLILRPAHIFMLLKELEERHPKETQQIRDALNINFIGV